MSSGDLFALLSRTHVFERRRHGGERVLGKWGIGREYAQHDDDKQRFHFVEALWLERHRVKCPIRWRLPQPYQITSRCLAGEIKLDAQNRGAIFDRGIAGTAEQGLIYVFEPLDVIVARFTPDGQQNGEIDPFRRQYACPRSPGLCSCSARRGGIAQIKQSRQEGTQFSRTWLAPLNQFVCGNSASKERNRDSAEGSAPPYNSATF